MELWSPPHDAPHLLEWWRPLILVSRRARLAGLPWAVHVDEFQLTGRVRRRGRPDVWIYEHHGEGGSLCIDAAGETYRFVATPRGRGVGQFRRCELATALRLAGLPPAVPVRRAALDAGAVGTSGPAAHPAGRGHAPPTPTAAELADGGPATPGTDDEGRPGAVRTVRRGHLTLIAAV